MSESVRGPNSYLDFSGLAELRGQARADSQGAIKRTAQQFEAMFIQMMLRAMREAQPGSDLLESNALDTYQSMQDKEVSMLMARRGALGIADMLTRQLDKVSPAASGTASVTAAGMPLASSPGLPLRPPIAALPLRKPAAELRLPERHPDGYTLPAGTNPATGQPSSANGAGDGS